MEDLHVRELPQLAWSDDELEAWPLELRDVLPMHAQRFARRCGLDRGRLLAVLSGVDGAGNVCTFRSVELASSRSARRERVLVGGCTVIWSSYAPATYQMACIGLGLSVEGEPR